MGTESPEVAQQAPQDLTLRLLVRKPIGEWRMIPEHMEANGDHVRRIDGFRTQLRLGDRVFDVNLERVHPIHGTSAEDESMRIRVFGAEDIRSTHTDFGLENEVDRPKAFLLFRKLTGEMEKQTRSGSGQEEVQGDILRTEFESAIRGVTKS